MSNKIPYTIIAESGAKKGVILMTGYISPWENNAAAFQSDFKNLEDSYSEIDINVMNLFGGSVFEGIPTYNLIKGSKCLTNSITHGLAASMGSLMAISGNNSRLIAPLSRVMIHRPTAGVIGDFEDLLEQSNLLKDLSDEFVQVYVQNSIKDATWIAKNWMPRGKDTYLNVAKCLEYGLMTGTTESKIKDDVPNSLLKKGDVKAIAEHYDKYIIAQLNEHTNTNTQTQMKEILMMLGLSPEASEQAAISAINAKVKTAVEAAEAAKDATITDLQAKLENQEKQTKEDAAETFATALVDAKKITPAAKQTYKDLHLANPVAAKAAADGLPSGTSIKEQLEMKNQGVPDATKTFDWYQKNDPDALLKMRTEDRPAYDELYNNHFGKK